MYLATQSRGQNPQTLTTKDVIDINKGVFELAEKIGGKDKIESGTLGIVKELTNMMRELYQKQLLDKLDEVKNAVGGRSSIWEEIFEDERKFNMLKELFGGKTTKPEIEIELEKLRQQHEINMKRLDLDLLKLRSEILEGRRKSKMFSQALRKIGEAIGEGLKESTEEGMTYEKQQTQQVPTTLKCPKCNTDIPDIKPDAIVTCPNCKSSYKVRVKQ
jgi:Zn finger protein HypA/HybF involved in hydrogenase expression